jgi:MtaA/CmuA family methyltransferase
MTGRERVLNHFAGKPVDCLPCMPITMMFASDFIGARYLDYCTDYRVMAEGQMRVSEEFDFDYVNVMSDPAAEASDLGATIRWYENQPPAIDEAEALLLDKSHMCTLTLPDPTAGRMGNRLKILAFYKEQVGDSKLIEGWVEGPCAEAADLRGINNLMTDFYDDPGFVTDLFDFIVDMQIHFAKHQVQAGADQIGIGDAAASLVGPQIYEEFVWPYEKTLVEAIQKMGATVRLHICGNTRRMLEFMGRLGCDLVELDSPSPLVEARQKMGPNQMLIGNMDPVRILREGTPEMVTAAVEQCHQDAGERYMAGAGCEVPRDTPHENLRALVAYAKSHQPKRAS